MCENHLQVSLGFADDKTKAGTHLCLVYTKEDERKDSLLKFLLSGLVGGERVSCFTDKTSEDDIREFFKANNISYDERKEKGLISRDSASEVYFEDNLFNPDRMIKKLIAYYKASMEMDVNACRVIGEMMPEVNHIEGGERLLEYEARVSLMLDEYPITAVCQYDANKFDGATIMEVFKVHEKMIVNGSIINNPFYVKPEEYLESINYHGKAY